MKYLKVFVNFAEVTEALTDAEIGRLFRAMMEYASTGTLPDLRGNERYAWDLETNTQSVQNFTNPHQREVTDRKTKKATMKVLTSDRDIYENNANMAARRLRARILAILPSWLVEAAINQCRKTVAAGEKGMILIDRIRILVQMFGKFGVTQDQIEKRLKKRSTQCPRTSWQSMSAFTIRSRIRTARRSPGSAQKKKRQI